MSDGGEGGKLCSSHLAQCLGFLLPTSAHHPPTQSLLPPCFSPQLLLFMACTSICCILTHLAHLAISRSLQYFLPSFHISGTVDPSISLAFCLHQITLKYLALLAIMCLCPTFCSLENVAFGSKLSSVLVAFQVSFKFKLSQLQLLKC